MKVSLCSNAAPIVDNTKPKTLTWDEIKNKEGVYKFSNDGTTRCIILTHPDGTTALFYHPNTNKLEPLGDWGKSAASKFEACPEETVCFEIKKA